MAECQVVMEGMGEIGKDATKRRIIHQIFVDVLYGGGLFGADIWIIVLVSIGSNGENGGRVTDQFPVSKHGEAVTAEHGRDVGGTGG